MIILLKWKNGAAGAPAIVGDPTAQVKQGFSVQVAGGGEISCEICVAAAATL